MKYLDDPVLEALSQALSCVHLGDARVFGRVEWYSCKNTDADHKLKQYLKKKFPVQEDLHSGIQTTDQQVQEPMVETTAPTIHMAVPQPTQSKSNHHGASSYYSSTSQVGVYGSGSFNGNYYHVGSANTGHHSLSPTHIAMISPQLPFGPMNRTSTSRKTLLLLLATLNAAFPDYDFSDINPECFNRIPFLSVIINQVNTTLFNQSNNNQELLTIISSRVWEAINNVVDIEDCDLYSFNPDPDVGPDAEEGNLWSFYYFFLNRRLKRMVFFTCRCVSAMAPIQPEERVGREDMDHRLREYTPSLEEDMSFEQYTMSNIEV